MLHELLCANVTSPLNKPVIEWLTSRILYVPDYHWNPQGNDLGLEQSQDQRETHLYKGGKTLSGPWPQNLRIDTSITQSLDSRTISAFPH